MLRDDANAIFRLMVRWRVGIVGVMLFWTVVAMVAGWQIALGLWGVGFVLTVLYALFGRRR